MGARESRNGRKTIVEEKLRSNRGASEERDLPGQFALRERRKSKLTEGKKLIDISD